ncbi:hypothetical protein DPMN_031167 [Dreissena polymorpha]|uniref:Uncharacterized protein n=1 Tax=Dreissena polymorpha TaxID=45954 RepID=A0A9D4M1D5_DREPO|nr:hypothetical protein DPMN_031167 [Dreissena polymorpha]
MAAMFSNRPEPFLNSTKIAFGTNLLTQFHDDPTINVACTVITRQIFMTHNGRRTIYKRKMPRPPGGHVFQPTQTIYILFREDRTINVASRVLTRKNAPPLFLDDRTIHVASRVLTRKNATPPWRPCLQPPETIFKLTKDIIGINLLTKFHEDRKQSGL